MKHNIIDKQNIDNNTSIVTVTLNPDNDTEKIAIRNLENMTATEIERVVVENYLRSSLGLGDYSLVDKISQRGATFIIKVYLESNQ